MTTTPITITDRDALRHCTVEITVKRSRWFDLRFRLGVWLIKLGHRIVGFTTRITTQESA